MTGDSVVIFAPLIDWNPISSSVSATVGSAATHGGFGINGHGSIFKIAALLGAAATSNPVPVAASLAGGTQDAAYSETISAQGGSGTYSFSVTSGSLPAGTSLNSSTGVISGTPTTAGSYSFTITVTDANSYTGIQNFTIIVANPSGGGNFGSIN